MGLTSWMAALALVAAGAGAPNDPFVGRWVLDVTRSSYPAGASPRAMVIEMESTGNGVHYRSDTTDANDNRLHAEYTASYDGNQALVVGGRGMMLPVFLRRIDSRTVNASYTKGLVVVATSRRVVSEDGREMTITTASKDALNKGVTTVAVYCRSLGVE